MTVCHMISQVLSQGQCHIDDFFGGHTALHVSCQNGHIDVVKCLVHHGANLEENVSTIIIIIYFIIIYYIIRRVMEIKLYIMLALEMNQM